MHKDSIGNLSAGIQDLKQTGSLMASKGPIRGNWAVAFAVKIQELHLGVRNFIHVSTLIQHLYDRLDY